MSKAEILYRISFIAVMLLIVWVSLRKDKNKKDG